MRHIRLDGHTAFFFNFDSRVISGWSFDVDAGDLVYSEMKSGKIGVFRIVSVKRMNDPRDQYFAKVEDVGYEGEVRTESAQMRTNKKRHLMNSLFRVFKKMA
jgi:hypothetical protein